MNKRISFLRDVTDVLKLDHIIAIHARAEELGKNSEYREKYDIAVSRAVSNLSTLVEYTLPFVRCGGLLYSYKGNKAQEEIQEAEKAVKILGGEITNTYNIEITDTDYIRYIIEMKKISSTPAKYPRKGNKASTDPIR